MRTPRRHRLTCRQSEQLLDRLEGPDELVRVLADAGRPAVPGELPGEAAALAAFREYAVSPAPDTRSIPVRTLPIRRGLAVKVLAASTAVVAIGGAAAAASGHLPVVSKISVHTTAAQSPASPTGMPSTDKDSAASTSHPTGDRSTDPQRDHDNALPTVGLCRAWVAVSKGGNAQHVPDALVQSKAFQNLVKQAGGKDQVIAYCESLVKQWCSDHKWPTTAVAAWQNHPFVFRCVPPGVPTASPTTVPGPIHRPSPVPTGPVASPPHTVQTATRK